MMGKAFSDKKNLVGRPEVSQVLQIVFAGKKEATSKGPSVPGSVPENGGVGRSVSRCVPGAPGSGVSNPDNPYPLDSGVRDSPHN